MTNHGHVVKPAFDAKSDEHAAFVAMARAAGLDPDDRWVAAYVDYEWEHLRLLIDAYGLDVSGRDVLEFGCNVGGSLITLAALGARVTGLDVKPEMVFVAEANAARYGLSSPIRLVQVPDTRSLPFGDESFDLVVANSVLEYVESGQLAAVLSELSRVLRPGGKLLICGTASRIAPREIHSRRWLVNYVPLWVDRLTSRQLQRGLGPVRLARALPGRFEDVGGDSWRKGRVAIHGRLPSGARIIAALARSARISPGWLSPNIEILLAKR